MVLSLGQEDPLEKQVVIHSSILAWKNPMDRGAWCATVHGVAKELDMTDWLSIAPIPPAMGRVGNSSSQLSCPPGIPVSLRLPLHSIVGLLSWVSCIQWLVMPMLSCTWLCNPIDYIAWQVSLSMGFFMQEYWSGCHFLLQGIFLTQGSNLHLLCLPQNLYLLSHRGGLDAETKGPALLSCLTWNCSREPSCFQASFTSTLSPGPWLSALPSQPQLSRHQLTFCQSPTTDTNSIQMNLIPLKKMMHIIRSFLIAPNVSLRTQG